MAQTANIPAGKKRYMITLNEEKMERLKLYLKGKGAPSTMISTLVDDFIGDILKTLDELETAQQEKGKIPGLGDLFTIIGGIMTEKENETDEKKGKSGLPRQKRDTVPQG